MYEFFFESENYFTMKTLLIGFLILPFFAFSQRDSLLQIKTLGGDDFKEIQEYRETKIVSASRTGKKIGELPFTVYVITKEEIRKNGYVTLVDALKMVPGMRTSKPGSGTRGETFLMRGLLGNEYAKILVNDVPIQPSVTGSFNIGENLPISQAERIEIIYGPNSAVYGADAMVGVINIITKETENNIYTEAQGLFGNDGYRHLDFMVGGKVGKDQNVWQYNFYANYAKRENWNIQDNTEVWDNKKNFRDFLKVSPEISDLVATNPDFAKILLKEAMPFYEGDVYNPTVGKLPHESRLMGFNLKFKNFYVGFNESYRKDHSSIGRTPIGFSYSKPDTYIAETVRRINMGYSRSFDKLSIISNVSYLRFRTDPQSSMATNYSNNGKSYIYSASDDIFGEFLASFRPFSWVEFTAGISGLYAYNLPTTNELVKPFDEIDYQPFTNYKKEPDPIFGNFGYNPQTIYNLGAFGQAYLYWKKFSMILGYRADQPSNYEGNSYSRIAAIYQFNDRFSLRFMGGFAFKAPPTDVLYASLAFKDNESDSLVYQIVPNTKLKPETYASSELGIRYKFSDKWDLDVSLLANEVGQRLARYERPISTKDYPLSVRNNGRPSFVRISDNDENSTAVMGSLQGSLRGRNIIPKIHLNTDLHFNLSKGIEVLPNNLGEINDMRQVPRWLIQWRISAQATKNLYINIEQVGVGSWLRAFVPTFGKTPHPTLVDGYYNLDISASYRLGKNANFFIKVFNVFDAKYGGIDATGLDVDLVYNPQLGRSFQFGINFMMD